MAAFATTMSLTTSSVVTPSSLSSRSAFASPVVSVAPCKSSRTGPLTVRASAAEEPKAARREMLATLLAAGAVLVSSGNASAAAGPGIGSQKTAKKADKLLKAGDDLIKNDSPPRYGGDLVQGGDSTKFSQQAGSGPVQGLQGGADKTIEGAKSNLRKAQARIDGIFGKKDTSTLGGNPLEKASSSIKSNVASTRGIGNKASNKAGNVVDQTQDKASSAVEQGKGMLSNLKDSITDAISK